MPIPDNRYGRRPWPPLEALTARDDDSAVANGIADALEAILYPRAVRVVSNDEVAIEGDDGEDWTLIIRQR